MTTVTKPYKPIHYWLTNDIMRCGYCQRVFTSEQQYRADSQDSHIMRCRHRSSCETRAKRLAGIHVKAWRDLCQFIAAAPGQAVTPLQVPAPMYGLVSGDGFAERVRLANCYLLPVRQDMAGWWSLDPDWEKRLQRIEQGEGIR